MPSSTAPLSPNPCPQITLAPTDSAHSATWSSSHATNVGYPRTASITPVAIHRANWARSSASSVPVRRPLAAVNRFTGTRTATSTGDDCSGAVQEESPRRTPK